jgi:hypothetical protein
MDNLSFAKNMSGWSQKEKTEMKAEPKTKKSVNVVSGSTTNVKPQHELLVKCNELIQLMEEEYNTTPKKELYDSLTSLYGTKKALMLFNEINLN